MYTRLNRAVKRNPKTNLRDATANWDFWTSLPEAIHQVTIVMSDRGIPKSYRTMHGFGSHTYSLINENDERIWVKFHWVCQQPIENLSNAEAAEIVANDRESHQRDLFDAIERGDFPKWKLCIQVMTEEQAAFAPSTIVPGISFSPDRMLQGRLFSYADAQRYRLGVNYHQIPVNAPKCPVNSYHRDGQGRMDGNSGSTISYAPNSFGEGAEQPQFKTLA
ncbi:catalase [Veillonella sp.]